MSRKLRIEDLSDEEIDTLNKDLEIEQEPSKYAAFAKPKVLTLYDQDEKYVYVPFAYKEDYSRPERKEFTSSNVTFEGTLREKQKEVKKEAIKYLNSTGSVIIACPPAFGKTCTAINLACQIKLRTLIVCHRVILIDQWKKSIQKFAPTAKIQVLTGKSAFQEADFYIINGTNVTKHSREFYKDIGLLIIDEAHIIMAEKMSGCMQYIVPRYVIGLSATPYRNDGLNILLDMYFGTNKIIRKQYREHIVYKINTKLKLETKTNKLGKIDWSSVIDAQCNHVDRNNFIIEIVKRFPERTFLILCKRVNQAEFLVERLKEEKEDVTSLIGSNQKYEQKSRILVGSSSKVGVGFDHPGLNSLILASDIEGYFEQYLGRVFRREDTVPMIFDLVDDYFLLHKHFKTREEVYKELGGEVKNFFLSYPEFAEYFKN